MNLRLLENDIVPKKVCAIHDLSCIGRCALTVIMPILSQLGIQVIPLPTAILSSHTGGYCDFSFLELTDEMKKITTHWQTLDTKFDCVYSGFLGDEKQIEFVLEFAKYCRKKNGTLFLADPVMGDDGIKYQTYTDEMCALTSDIAKNADVITPNLTEACILMNTPYRENFTKYEIKDMLCELSNGGNTSVVITGVADGEDAIGARYFDRETGAFGNHSTQKIGVSYPGTGDAFSSVVLGALLRGRSLAEAVYSAVSYIYSAVNLTYRMGTPIREGILLESIKIQDI
ncbi:MAG: pyridoxamine kinase [Clostridia bacterium]|nr:pyridoxamine kinase [Clostridia bacterium]